MGFLPFSYQKITKQDKRDEVLFHIPEGDISLKKVFLKRAFFKKGPFS